MKRNVSRTLYLALSLLMLTPAAFTDSSMAQTPVFRYYPPIRRTPPAPTPIPLPEPTRPTPPIGGDTQCSEYYHLASRTNLMLAQIGDPTIQRTLPFISTGSLREVVRNLKVIPTYGLDREALSDRTTLTTYLDLDKWSRIPTVHQKIGLILHELLVLDGKEGEGEYAISQVLKTILLASRYAFELKCESFVYNVDGTVTVFAPFFLGDDGVKYRIFTSDTQGTSVCRYLGFSGGQSQLDSDSGGNFAVLTTSGAIKNLTRNVRNVAGVETAVCKQ